MTNFLIVEDGQYKAFFNAGAICMFRVKRADDGRFPVDGEIEIEFMGGSKTRLLGATAKNFFDALVSTGFQQ